MRITNINDQNIYYLKKGDPIDLEPIDIYKNIFAYMSSICKHLQIECPDLALVGTLTNMYDGSVMGGELYDTKEFPNLDNKLILLSIDDVTFEQAIGFLLHELRHVWQHQYLPEIDTEHAHGFLESLHHPAEIDADGFAIWYLSNLKKISFEDAADIVCPIEKASFKDAYRLRISKAMQFETHHEKLNTPWKISGIHRNHKSD